MRCGTGTIHCACETLQPFAFDSAVTNPRGSDVMATNFVMPVEVHNQLVSAAYRQRGYTADEADAGAKFSEITAWHGIKTHNALKALHLDEHFGSKAGGC